MTKGKAIKIGAVILAVAFVTGLSGVIAAKMDCKESCDTMKTMCVDSCTKGVKLDPQAKNPRAVAKCKEVCESARKKCEEICKEQEKGSRGGLDD